MLGGVYDGLTTRLAEQAGFEVLFIGGFSVAATLLGEPDFGYLTQTEMADAARRVCRLTTPAGAGRRRHRLRQRAQRPAHGRALPRRRRRRAVPRGPGVAEALRPHAAASRSSSAREWLSKLRAVRSRARQPRPVPRRAHRRARRRSASTRRSRAARRRATSAPTRCSSRRRSRSPSWSRSRAPSPAPRSRTWSRAARRRCCSPAELHALGFDLIVTPLAALLAAARAVRDVYAELRRSRHDARRPRPAAVVRRVQRADRSRAPLRARAPLPRRAAMKAHTEYLIFNTRKRHELVNITDRVAEIVQRAAIREGMCLVSAMHITAGDLGERRGGRAQARLPGVARAAGARAGPTTAITRPARTTPTRISSARSCTIR